MDQKVKTGLGVIVIIIFALTAGMFVWQAQKNKLDKTQPIKVNIPEKIDDTTDLSSKASATKDWQTYRNEKFGFQMTFPSDWQGYKVLTCEVTGENAVAYIRIYLPTTDKSWPEGGCNPEDQMTGFASRFVISVFDTQSWNKEKIDLKEREIDLTQYEKLTMIGKSSNYVFILGGPQDTPRDTRHEAIHQKYFMNVNSTDQFKSDFNFQLIK